MIKINLARNVTIMKHLIYLFFSCFSLFLHAQVEITNLDMVIINNEPSPQHISIHVQNISIDTIDLDWSIEFQNNAESFLEISVSDINIEYTPQIQTSCDLSSITNILSPSEEGLMSLHFILGEVPTTFSKDSTLAFFYLYTAEECSEEEIIKLPIIFEGTSTTTSLIPLSKTFEIYPNPATNFIKVLREGFHNPKSYKIYDFKFQQVLSGTIERNEIDISMLPKGVYTFRSMDQSRLFIKH